MITSSGRSRSSSSNIVSELPSAAPRCGTRLMLMPSLSVAVAALLTLGCSGEQSLTVTATAFNSTRAQTDSSPLETACGTRLDVGDQVIAVSRDLSELGLACGTELEIEGLAGTWTVVDRTSAKHERRIDIYMGLDIKAAREWGVREVTIRWCE
jgi:3D (Asp-Asp-Asp) domain-containing protein